MTVSNSFSSDNDPLKGFTPVNPLELTLHELQMRVAQLELAGVHSFSTPLPPDHYRCCVCLRTERKGWSDAEAAAEYAQRFPDDGPLDVRYTVCNDCNRLVSSYFGLEL